MDDVYTKVDEYTAKVETTFVVVEENLTLESLNYDRDSLVRTIENNNQEAVDKNAVVQALIDEIDTKINKLKELGVKLATVAEIPTVLREVDASKVNQ